MVHHFAHEGDSDCKGALETALHLAAKEILSRELRMILPPVVESAKVKDIAGIYHEAIRMLRAKSVVFDSISQEVNLGKIVPDLLAIVGDKTLLIEIAVTHFASEEKLAFLNEMGLASVEVDLSGMPNGWSWEALTTAIVEQPSNKKWLFNPRSVELQSLANQDAATFAATDDKAEAVRKTHIQESKEQQRAAIPGFLPAIERLAQFISTDNLAVERARMDVEGPNIAAWKSASSLLGICWEEPPVYLNIEVAGEAGFTVDRRVWQASLFAMFVRNSALKEFTGGSVATWGIQTFGRRHEFDILQKREYNHLLNPDEQWSLPFASRAVSGYLRALESFGFICGTGDSFQIVRRR